MTTRAQSVTTLVLVSVAAALGAYLLLIERGKPTSEELETRKNNLVHVFRRDELSEIVLEVGGEKVRIARVASPDGAPTDFQLFVTSGASDPSKSEAADPTAIDRLVQSLEMATPLRTVDANATPASMGLDRPRAVVSLRMGNSAWRLELGGEATTPAGACYASVPGEGFFVVSRSFAADLLKPIDTYRSRIILPYVASDLFAIRLDGGAGARNLTRGAWGGFRVDTAGGKGPRVHRVVFDQLLNAFAGMRAERYMTASAAEEVLRGARSDGSLVSLVLEPIDKTRPTARLEMGGQCPARAVQLSRDAGEGDAGSSDAGKLVVVVRREPQPMFACIASSTLEPLRASYELLADKHLLDLNPDDIEELKVQRAGRVLEIVRKASGWKLRSPEERDVSGADAKGFMEGLTRLEGEIMTSADLKAVGLEPPSGSLVVIQPASGHQEHPQQKLELGDDQGPFAWVRRVQDGVVLRIPRNQAHLIEPVTTYIRSSELLDLSPDRIRKVSTSWGNDDKQSVARTPSGFKLEAPAGHFADGSLSADLFDTVAKLTAERWVADHDDGSYGFSQPRATAQIEAMQDGGVKVWRLLVGGRIGDGTYARWEPDTGVFILPRSAETALSSYAIDRSYFMLDPAEVESLTLIAGGKKAAISSVSERKWVADANSGVSLPESSVDRIQAAFLEMRAEGVVHLGEPQDSEGFGKPLMEVLVRRVPGHDERSKDIRMLIGRGDVWRTVNVYFARRDGISATYAIAASRLKPVLSAMGIE